jgi:DNA-binding protein YbaB
LEATKEAMQDFYGNALNAAVEKVYEYTDSME